MLMVPPDPMPDDMRRHELFAEAEALYRAVRRPGERLITDASHVDVSTDARTLAFTGLVAPAPYGSPRGLLCQLDLAAGRLDILLDDANDNRMPTYRPGGGPIAFLSDRDGAADGQLFFLDPGTSAVSAAPPVDGVVERFCWSPDGRRILLLVAGHGADVAAAQGGVAGRRRDIERPGWMPHVSDGAAPHQWRTLWLLDLAEHRLTRIPAGAVNIWEACWAGSEAIVAVVSDGPGEGDWFRTRLVRMTLDGRAALLLHPERQLGHPAASRSGEGIAVVQAIASDRGIVAGDLWVSRSKGEMVRLDTGAVDIACVEWLDERRLLVAGHRGLESVSGVVDSISGAFQINWASAVQTSPGRHLAVRAIGTGGDCALVSEGFCSAPAISTIVGGRIRRIVSFDAGYEEVISCLSAAEPIKWEAVDGLAIDGWLLRPKGKAPYPVILDIHGGPVWHWRQRWLGRTATGLQTLLLLRHGYAIFLPNPRGSSGYGPEFAARVIGDVGGADAGDLLSGIDHLVKMGFADPSRIGVTGGSYGGYMAAWLATQDPRFAAVVTIAPVINRISQQLTTNQPEFVTLFMRGRHDERPADYVARSPVTHVAGVSAPVLNIAGALDRCTPASEAVQFHNALLLAGKRSTLVIYPEEGHGVANVPAMLDYAARVTAWFLAFIQPGVATEELE
jgi:dipeptidyl aminopeptidase/acylaminoacyl peptidase